MLNTLIANLRHGHRTHKYADIGGGRFSPDEQLAAANEIESLLGGTLVYVNMQKRGDGKVYADLHKTTERIYFTPEDAQAAIDADPELTPFRHVVALVCRVATTEELE